MNLGTVRDGRITARPLLLVLGIAAVAAGGVWLQGRTSQPPRRGSATVANPGAATPVTVITSRGFPTLVAAEGPDILVPDSVPPDQSARLLWLEGRATQPVRGGAVVLDGAGGILVFDSQLRATRPTIGLDGREVVSISAGPDGGWWLTDARGSLVQVDRDGRTVVEENTLFLQPAVTSDSLGDHVWLARSPTRFAYAVPPADVPLAAQVILGATARPIGRAVIPDHLILTDLANAGHLVVGQDALYFAPFIRDEILAMSFGGDTLWVASRNLPQTTREPRFELEGGRAVIDYHPVNLGMVLGPNGHLYALSTPGFNMMEARLDEFDPSDGRLLASVLLPTAQPTLAADPQGRVYALDGIRLLSGVPSHAREAFAPFDLPKLDGGRAATESLMGRVTVVNFWASWCTPCRTEMPALDALRQSIPDAGFQMLGFNEDSDRGDAAAFVTSHQVRFPVLLGGGQLRARYHLPGLPVTLVVDRQGRVAGRWIGQLESRQIADIRAVIAAELSRRDPGDAPGGHHHHPEP